MDDTLYDESTYVKSSFKAVAFYISEKYSLSENTIFEDLILVLNNDHLVYIFHSSIQDEHHLTLLVH